MAGEALRLAVELQCQPMLRHALRHRPLPDGVEELVSVASGSPARLAGPASTLALPAEQVLQAARFFVQEILLHGDADAYRVLGVDADADDARIKRHYRALQLWLHPDRLANSPESIYSSRVNQAWDLLRTPVRRKAFDAAAEASRTVQPAAASGSHVQRWERVEYTADSPWRPQLIASIGLFVLCAALLWLALRESPAPTLPEPLDWARQAADGVESLVATLTPEPDSERPIAPPAPHQPVPGAAPPGLALPLQEEVVPAVAIDAGRHPEAVAASSAPPTMGTSGNTLAASSDPAATPPPEQAASAAHPAGTGTGNKARAPDRTGAVAVAEVVAEPAPVSLDATGPADLLARHDAARAQAARLLGFLTRRNSAAPPIWRSVPALASAEAVRAELTRGSPFRRPKVEQGRAHWTLGQDVAVMAMPVLPADRAASPGSLQARLVWHQDAWWVDAVTLEAPP